MKRTAVLSNHPFVQLPCLDSSERLAFYPRLDLTQMTFRGSPGEQTFEILDFFFFPSLLCQVIVLRISVETGNAVCILMTCHLIKANAF